MELTLVRHGESLANAGQSDELDSALTPLGELQAVAAGHSLEVEIPNKGPYTVALVSPFRRTLMTYERINQSIHTPAFIYHELHEYFSDRDSRYHQFSGLTCAQISLEFPWITIDEQFTVGENWWPDRLESKQTMFDRAVRARAFLVNRYSGDRRIVLVSHAETIGRLIEAFTFQEPRDQAPLTDNCGIWRLEVHNNSTPAEIVLANDTKHLTGIVRADAT